MEINEITSRTLAAAVRVHRQLGPGLLESAYQTCLATELEKDGLRFDREVRLPVVYDGVRLDAYYRPDFVVEGRVIVEVKSVRTMDPLFTAQTLTYMRVGNYPVGLLINFNASYLGDGAIKRLVYNYDGKRPGDSA